MNFLKHKTSKSKIFVTSITLTWHLSCLFLPCAVLNDTNNKIVFNIFSNEFLKHKTSRVKALSHQLHWHGILLCVLPCAALNDTNNEIVFEISPMNFEPQHIHDNV